MNPFQCPLQSVGLVSFCLRREARIIATFALLDSFNLIPAAGQGGGEAGQAAAGEGSPELAFTTPRGKEWLISGKEHKGSTRNFGEAQGVGLQLERSTPCSIRF
jgi:hypothetical protein